MGLYSIYWFVLETNNGGLHQFFYNDSGQYAPSARSYLQRIGASKTADILNRAIQLFPDSKVPADWSTRQDLMLDQEELFEPLDGLTNELFQCGENVNDFHLKFVAMHPDLFSRVHDPKK